MPKNTVTTETQLATRNDFTKIDAVITITVDGREIPSVAVLGSALDEARETIQKRIKAAYELVPARV